jgi:hypothetical protein
MDYVNATPEEKEAWIKAFIDRRVAEGNELQRKGMGTNTGTMSVKSTARYKARVKWNRGRQRQLKSPKHSEEDK